MLAMREAVGLIATFMALMMTASAQSQSPIHSPTATSLKIASINKDAKVINDMAAAFPLLTVIPGKQPSIEPYLFC